MTWRDEEELSMVVQQIHRHHRIRWADCAALLLALGLIAALAVV